MKEPKYIYPATNLFNKGKIHKNQPKLIFPLTNKTKCQTCMVHKKIKHGSAKRACSESIKLMKLLDKEARL